jgi:uncharacterized protein
MLIEFQVQNFRSFKERQTLSMVAAALPEHLKSNTFDPNLRGFDRLLRAAVIYGPNAAGKTNLMHALQAMQSFVISSAATTGSGTQYPYRPFKLSKTTRNQPSEFGITLVQNGRRYEYGFSVGEKQVEKEWLIEHVESKNRTRGRKLFERIWDKKRKSYDWDLGQSLKGEKTTWRNATRDDALFLSTATQLNSAQLRPLFDWFKKKLVVIAGQTQLNRTLTLQIWDEPDGKKRLLPFLKEADLGIVDIAIQREPLPQGGAVLIQGPDTMLHHRPGQPAPDYLKIKLSHASDDPELPVEFDFEEESSGTKILFTTAGAWLNVIKNGEVLLFDEIDTNMHPKLLSFLIQKFQSNTTNPNNAQMICSTHNTTLLDKEIFRRDQFWFVEKDNGGASKLYPLTDFSPRNDEVIERWYMRGRYGALPILPAVPK